MPQCFEETARTKRTKRHDRRDLRDISINPDTCQESDLALKALAGGHVAVQLKHIRLNSIFFADDKELFFLRESVDRISNAGFNLWSFETNEATGDLALSDHAPPLIGAPYPDFASQNALKLSGD